MSNINPHTNLLTGHYRQATEHITESLKEDKNVLAVVLLGSLADGIMWEKSDLNLVVVVRDDKISGFTYHVDEGGIICALEVCSRTEFTRAIKYMNVPQISGCGEPFALPQGGQMLYCTDESLNEVLEDLARVGKADMERALLQRACDMLYYLKKAEKCIRVHDDTLHARYYLLELAKPLAELEICLNYKVPSKEPLLQAAELNPALMQRFYEYPMNKTLDTDGVLALIQEAYDYLDSHMDVISRRLLKFLSDRGNPKRTSDIMRHFAANVIHITEYLCEKGVIDKLCIPIPITAKGRQVVEELAYYYEGGL